MQRTWRISLFRWVLCCLDLGEKKILELGCKQRRQFRWRHEREVMSTEDRKHQLFDHIKKCLPDCEEEEIEQMLNICWKNGIRQAAHFSETVVEKSLLRNDGAPAVFVSLLYASASTNTPTSPVITATAAQQPTTQSELTPVTNPGQRMALMILNYIINWQSIGYEKELNQATRITKGTRTDIVRKIISDVINKFGHKDNPGNKLWNAIANQLCTRYEHHFADIMDEGRGKGHSNIAKKLDNRFREVRRNQISGYSDDEENQHVPIRKKAKRSDTLFCQDYAPDLPAGETEESQEATRVELFEINGQPKDSWNLEDILLKSNITYSTVRDLINNSKESPISILKQDWPLFFIPKVLHQHFKRLTGIDGLEKMHKFNSDLKLQSLLQFLCTHTKKDGRKAAFIFWSIDDAAPQLDLNMQYLAAMHMITLYMNESIKELAVNVKDPYASDQDIENLARNKLPNTPLIIIVGDNICTSSDYRLMIDQRVVCHAASFMEALVLNFAAYYIFRIHYAAKLKSTLEYFQICVMGIIPEEGEGTKSKKKGGGSCPEKRQNVIDLIDDIESFKRSVNEMLDKFPSYNIAPQDE